MDSSCRHSLRSGAFFPVLISVHQPRSLESCSFQRTPPRQTVAVRRGLCVTCKDLEIFLCVCVSQLPAMLVLVSGHPSWDLYSLPLMLTPYVLYSA